MTSHVSESQKVFWAKVGIGFAFVSTITAGIGGYHLGHHYAKNFMANPKIASIAFAITGLVATASLFCHVFSLYMLNGIKKFHDWKGFQNVKVISAITFLNLTEIIGVGAITMLAFKHLGLVASKGIENMAGGISAYAVGYLSFMAILLSANKKENPQINYVC